MKVVFKRMDVQMEVKNKGVEIDVLDTSGKHVGDLVITKTKVIWCQGRTTPKHGKSLTWEEFIKRMQA